MKTYVFKYDCEDDQDRSLIAAFPYGQVTIEKDSLKYACEWFVQFLYPKFDRFANGGCWRLKLLSVTENDVDVTKESYKYT